MSEGEIKVNEDTSDNILTADDLLEIKTSIDELAKTQRDQLASNQALLKEIQKINQYNEAQEKAQKQAKQEADTKAEAEAQQAEADALEAEEQAKADAEVAEQKEQAQTERAETYTEILTDIRSELDFSNQVYAGQILFIGIITGILIAKIFIDRFIKL